MLWASGCGDAGLSLVGFGVNLFDVDNDGSLDAFIANGHIFGVVQMMEHLASGKSLRIEEPSR